MESKVCQLIFESWWYVKEKRYCTEKWRKPWIMHIANVSHFESSKLFCVSSLWPELWKTYGFSVNAMESFYPLFPNGSELSEERFVARIIKWKKMPLFSEMFIRMAVVARVKCHKSLKVNEFQWKCVAAQTKWLNGHLTLPQISSTWSF